MNKIYFILGAIILLNACSKDHASPNTSNQTTSGEVKIVIWWDKGFSDSMQAHGMKSIGAFIRRDGLFRYDTMFSTSSYWNSAPACDANNVNIFKDELGKTGLFEVIMTDTFGNVIFNNNGNFFVHDSVYLTAGQCHQVKYPNTFK